MNTLPHPYLLSAACFAHESDRVARVAGVARFVTISAVVNSKAVVLACALCSGAGICIQGQLASVVNLRRSLLQLRNSQRTRSVGQIEINDLLQRVCVSGGKCITLIMSSGAEAADRRGI